VNSLKVRRTNTSGQPLAVHRAKVTFKDEPGEGSGVARSFYTAIANVSTDKPVLFSLHYSYITHLFFEVEYLCAQEI
jgi:hypothetical protein